MPMIFAKPGEALYVTQPTSFFLPRSISPGNPILLRPDDPPMYVRHADLENLVRIPLHTIVISIGPTNIETADKATVDVRVTLAVETRYRWLGARCFSLCSQLQFSDRENLLR